jgi:hypothetical protein
MAEVYLYFDLNLAATASSDGRGGCLVSISTAQTTAAMAHERTDLTQVDPNLKPEVPETGAIRSSVCNECSPHDRTKLRGGQDRGSISRSILGISRNCTVTKDGSLSPRRIGMGMPVMC